MAKTKEPKKPKKILSKSIIIPYCDEITQADEDFAKILDEDKTIAGIKDSDYDETDEDFLNSEENKKEGGTN